MDNPDKGEPGKKKQHFVCLSYLSLLHQLTHTSLSWSLGCSNTEAR